MMIAARNAFLMSGGSSTPTARDYVQDGLLAMWDGIENAGWGTHDASATVWKDLTGNGYDFTLQGATFGDSTIHIYGDSARMSKTFPDNSIRTIEIGPMGTSGAMLFNVNSNVYLGSSTSSSDGKTRITGFMEKYASQQYDSIRGIYNTCTCVFNEQYKRETAYADGQPTQFIIWTAWAKQGQPYQISIPNYYTFIGDLRFMRFYSRALTAAEVAANYAIDAARFGL